MYSQMRLVKLIDIHTKELSNWQPFMKSVYGRPQRKYNFYHFGGLEMFQFERLRIRNA